MVAGNGGAGRIGGGVVERLGQLLQIPPSQTPLNCLHLKALVFMLREYWPCQVGLHW
jgi:hypothetical protein